MKRFIEYKIDKSLVYLVLTLCCIMLITSCQEPLDIDYSGGGDPVLVVEGKITTDTTRHFVKLSNTIQLNQSELDWVSNATVTIANNGNVFTLTEDEPGHYYTEPDFYGQLGEKYDLKVELENGELYEASTTIQNISVIDSVKFLFEELEDYDLFFHYLYFHGRELPEEGNAYRWNLYINDSLYNDTLHNTTFVDDEFVNGRYIGIGIEDGVEVSDFAVYTLEPYEFTTNTNYITLEMESIPLGYYDFWVTLMQQTEWTGSPFDANKADIKTNLSNGALGYFYGASIARYSFEYILPDSVLNFDQDPVDF